VIGYDRKVAMEMAGVLAGLDTVIVPTGGADGVNPLDLDGMLGLFGVRLGPEDAAPPPPPPPPPPVAVVESVPAPAPAATEGGAAQ
jgi:hypothetical protein